MPHPKHRFSQTRTAKRRTHDSLESPAHHVQQLRRSCNVSPCMPRVRVLQRQISHRKECRVVKSSLRFEVDSKGALL